MKFWLLVVSFIYLFILCNSKLQLINEESSESEKIRFDPDKDVRFFLYTRQNPTVPHEINYREIEAIRKSFYNKFNGLRVTVHGFLGEGEGNYNKKVVEAYLQNGDFNVIAVDWGEGAQTVNYIAARNRVGPVGESLARLLDFLYENGELDFNLITLTGISLGAHVVGMAGKSLRTGKVDTIIGLDPAGPLFSVSQPESRLAIGDARYVEAIHTNGAILGLGIGEAIGNADFFVNGGSKQPGCSLAYCSHARSANLFLESIRFPTNNFIATRCNSVTEAKNGECHGERGFFMAGEPSNSRQNLSGIFHLRTNGESPFGQGI